MEKSLLVSPLGWLFLFPSDRYEKDTDIAVCCQHVETRNNRNS
nr:MAG TPA: hypothetical protein [Caudoviricetes sp.]